jgi:hypothetical protein
MHRETPQLSTGQVAEGIDDARGSGKEISDIRP